MVDAESLLSSPNVISISSASSVLATGEDSCMCVGTNGVGSGVWSGHTSAGVGEGVWSLLVSAEQEALSNMAWTLLWWEASSTGISWSILRHVSLKGALVMWFSLLSIIWEV